ncbi:hypothetical protein BV25DRAFT_1829519 [Artomyces pyxidatus]|uniref:Uncharacterized protein n=1 Tax=Artomyces pyxidatus TaxID=48021 RepID=A0ACB8SQU0_9AGAM|nr:hypothetical protein BV25DRAFT_1829519 [Artomyces pyxidatus]
MPPACASFRHRNPRRRPPHSPSIQPEASQACGRPLTSWGSGDNVCAAHSRQQAFSPTFLSLTLSRPSNFVSCGSTKTDVLATPPAASRSTSSRLSLGPLRPKLAPPVRRASSSSISLSRPPPIALSVGILPHPIPATVEAEAEEVAVGEDVLFQGLFEPAESDPGTQPKTPVVTDTYPSPSSPPPSCAPNSTKESEEPFWHHGPLTMAFRADVEDSDDEELVPEKPCFDILCFEEPNVKVLVFEAPVVETGAPIIETPEELVVRVPSPEDCDDEPVSTPPFNAPVFEVPVTVASAPVGLNDAEIVKRAIVCLDAVPEEPIFDAPVEWVRACASRSQSRKSIGTWFSYSSTATASSSTASAASSDSDRSWSVDAPEPASRAQAGALGTALCGIRIFWSRVAGGKPITSERLAPCRLTSSKPLKIRR